MREWERLMFGNMIRLAANLILFETLKLSLKVCFRIYYGYFTGEWCDAITMCFVENEEGNIYQAFVFL